MSPPGIAVSFETPLGLRIVDQGSKNGTYFEGRRQRSFYLEPGQAFTVGARAHRVLALDDEMHAHYPALTSVLGYEDEHVGQSETPSPSDLIVAAVTGSHMLIASEPHCDQDRLARIVHAISLFRERPLVAQRDLALDRAATVLLDLDGHGDPSEPALTSRMFSPRYQTRVIALARTTGVANAVLGERCVEQMTHVRLVPLSRRRGAVHRLLDQLFQECGSSLRVSAMTSYNQDALHRHRWARNFASLREAADRLLAIARESSLRRAALVLGIPPSSFHHWFSNILGLTQPLLAGAHQLRGELGEHPAGDVRGSAELVRFAGPVRERRRRVRRRARRPGPSGRSSWPTACRRRAGRGCCRRAERCSSSSTRQRRRLAAEPELLPLLRRGRRRAPLRELRVGPVTPASAIVADPLQHAGTAVASTTSAASRGALPR